MVDFAINTLLGTATLEPGVYQLFTLGNVSEPSGGPIPGTTFTVAPPVAPAGDPPASGLAIGQPVTGGTNGDALAIDASGKLAAVPFPAPAIVTGFTVCANETELQAAVNAVASQSGGGGILRLAPGSIQLTSTLTVPVTDQGDEGVYFDVGRSPMVSGITDGVTPLIKLVGAVKHMIFENLVIFGGAFAGAGCGDGLQIVSSGGPILLSQFANISSSWCGGHGVVIQGDVYENVFPGLDCKNNKGSGLVVSTPNGGVVSNLMIPSPNLSRNNRFGCEVLNFAQSIDLPAGGSFINNFLGGWQGPIRSASLVNFENTGPAGFDFSGGLPYPATLIGCNLTSDMGTANTPANVSTTLVKYAGANGDGKLNMIGCYVTPEGAATASQLSVLSP